MLTSKMPWILFCFCMGCGVSSPPPSEPLPSVPAYEPTRDQPVVSKESKKKSQSEHKEKQKDSPVEPGNSRRDLLARFSKVLTASSHGKFITHQLEDNSVLVAVDNCNDQLEEDGNANLYFVIVKDDEVVRCPELSKGLPRMGYVVVRGRKAKLFNSCSSLECRKHSSNCNCRKTNKTTAYRYLSKIIGNTKDSLWAVVTFDSGATGDSGTSGKLTDLYRFKGKQWKRVGGTRRVNTYYSHAHTFGGGL
ncbi:MAG: hypothetical protein GY854_21360, partial [Deltaproteobacteria bacterium]|nr:hypothetical protein [Deltaproteobacteria bacterium]